MMNMRKDDKGTDAPVKYNPAIYDIIFFGFRLVARLLKEMGVVKQLEEKAAASENEMDDKGVRIVKHILDEMSK